MRDDPVVAAVCDGRISLPPIFHASRRHAATVSYLNPTALHQVMIFDRHHIWFPLRFFLTRCRHDESARSAQGEAEKNNREFEHPAHGSIPKVCCSNSARMLTQASQISKAVNAGAVSIAPAGLQCISSHQIEPHEFEAFVVVAHVRSRNMTEHIRLAAARSAWARAPQHFKL